jgi:uncharacterized tellurite resistance protein B-like protein
MSKSVKKTVIYNEGNVTTSTSIDAYDTFSDLRLHVAEDQGINFIGMLWRNNVIEFAAINKIVVAIDDTVCIYQLV